MNITVMILIGVYRNPVEYQKWTPTPLSAGRLSFVFVFNLIFDVEISSAHPFVRKIRPII